MANIDDKIYKFMFKVNGKVNPDSTIVTDGFGNSYVVPSEGKTPLFQVEGWNFQYNWKTGELEIFDKNSQFVCSYNVNAENFIDSPSYWAKAALQANEDEISAVLDEFNVNEMINKYIK